MVRQVLNWALACDNGLDEESKHCEHSLHAAHLCQSPDEANPALYATAQLQSCMQNFLVKQGISSSCMSIYYAMFADKGNYLKGHNSRYARYWPSITAVIHNGLGYKLDNHVHAH